MPTTPRASASANAVFLDPSFPPTNSTLSILSRPASFVPAPNSNPHSEIRRQVLDFVRKLHWSAALPTSNPPLQRLGRIPSTRWPPRTLVPASVLKLTSRIRGAVRTFLGSAHSCHTPNLAEEESREVARLRSAPTVFRPSDKGGKWAALPLSQYRTEALRQLNNSRYYEPISTDPSPHIARRLLQLLTHLHASKFISTREFRFLLPPTQPQTRRFYLLPKLHKEIWPSSHMPPGRPIVSDISSVSRKCSDLVSFFLLPLCAQQASHLKDSGHLIALLRGLDVSDGDLLFSMDVEALYTNIPIEEGVEAVAQAFRRNPSLNRPDLTIISLLRAILSSNVFAFEGNLWLQTSGVAMGNPFGGAFANIFMASWETKALDSSPLKPTFWRRYQDDVIGIWPHGESSLKAFHDHLNRQHPNIRLSLEFGASVNFLDLNISKADGSLHFSLFCKDTDTHLVLPPSSYHPPHTFRAVVYGEILRFATHSSSQAAFKRAYSAIAPVWRGQGYSRSLIRTAKGRALSFLGLDASWTPGMFPCHRRRCHICPHAIFSSKFGDSFSNSSFPIHCRFTCDSANVVYLIHCSNCRTRYVGETGRKVRQRMTEHLRSIRGYGDNLLALHFSSRCRPEHFTFLCIDGSPNPARRKAKEAKWIRTLRTLQPTGLNVQPSSEPKTVNLILPYSTCSARLGNTIRKLCDSTPMRVTFTRGRNLRDLLS